jgi:hypothetical protein
MSAYPQRIGVAHSFELPRCCAVARVNDLEYGREKTLDRVHHPKAKSHRIVAITLLLEFVWSKNLLKYFHFN